MTVTAAERRAAPLQERLRRALQHVTEPPVELRETHLSWVLLTRDRAYKLRKPVRLPFVDQSTPARRYSLAFEEARLNAPLAPGLVLGVRAVVPLNTSVVLADRHTPGAVDWVVEMRRFDETAALAAHLAAGRPVEAEVRQLGARLAAFHAQAEPIEVGSPLAHAHALVNRNIEELLPLLEGVAPLADLLALQRFVTAFVIGRRGELTARADAGRIVDGHGDLRAEHVVLERGGTLVVDRLEFDPQRRALDTGDDLAFLVMDLLGHGAPEAARGLVAAYRAAGGDPGSDAHIAFWAVHRALVRARVDLLQGRPEGARAHLALAARLTWAGRGPSLVLVTGPPGSGKSTLARALGAASGLPVLSSDLLRKARLGLSAAQAAPAAAYRPQERAEVYRELGEAADTLLAEGGAIVDATFGEPRLQDAFFGALDPEGVAAVRAVRCEASDEVRLDRLRERTPGAAAGSDAEEAVGRLPAASAGPAPVTAEHRLTLETAQPPETLVARVAAWLDEVLAEA